MIPAEFKEYNSENRRTQENSWCQEENESNCSIGVQQPIQQARTNVK